MSPRFSIVLPVFNGDEFLRRALESVRGQTERDFECIVVDDGSTDGSLAVAQDFAARDVRYKILETPHGGIVAALNAGLRCASAPFLVRMDADDIMLPERLALQGERLLEDKALVALGGATMAIDIAGRQIFPINPPLNHAAIVDQLRHGKGSAIIHPSVIFRTEAVRAVGGYREEYRHIEDLDLFWRLARHGRLGNLSEQILLYRLHPGSVNVKQAKLQRERTEKWLREVVAAEEGSAPPLKFYRAETRAQLYHDWAVKALTANHGETALRYSCKALVRAPFHLGSWKVALVSLKKASLAVLQKG